MTEQEKEKTIKTLQAQVNAAVSYLVILQEVTERNGTADLHPVLKDPTIQTMMGFYRQIMAIRSY